MKNDVKVKNRKVEELEIEVAVLKEDVSGLKRILVLINKKINSLEPVIEVKTTESKKTNEKKDEKENSEQNEEQVFKCDKCDYRAKRKVTFNKHMNTKHGRADKVKGAKEQKKYDNEKEKKEVDGMENDCRNCVSCEKCDYLKNSDNCKMCDKVFDDALDKYVDKGKQSTEGSALHSLLHNP